MTAGDAEDVAGKPFGGPAGKLLDRGPAEAGIEPPPGVRYERREQLNWEETRGKRRIHKKPNARQVSACRQLG